MLSLGETVQRVLFLMIEYESTIISVNMSITKICSSICQACIKGAWESARTNVLEPNLVGLEEAWGCYQQ